MTVRCIYLLARERIDKATPAEHYELLEALRALHLTIIEALTL
jgi:hypothetical protein